MTVLLRYFMNRAVRSYFDARTPGADYALDGQAVSISGAEGADYVRVAPGVEFDARGLRSGADAIIFSYRWDQYTKNLTDYAGSIVFTATDPVSGAVEKVIVFNGATTIGRDTLVFADGAVQTTKATEALRNNIGASLAAVANVDTGLTNTTVAHTVDGAGEVRAYASGASGGTGATFAMSVKGQTYVVGGTSAVDRVYVAEGTVVDARNLAGGSDIIYLTGFFADYQKSLSALSGGIQFTRTVNGQLEQVSVSNGASAAGRDRIVFADGMVGTRETAAALTANINAQISQISGYDPDTVTPFVSNVRSVAHNAGQSTGLLSGWANPGDTVAIDVSLNQAVIVDTSAGVPRLAVQLNGETRYATYDAARSTSTLLVFAYTVLAGDNDTDGLAVPRNAIELNGGAVHLQSNGASAVLTNPIVAADTSIRVDSVKPTIQSVSFAGQAGAEGGLLNTGDTASFDVKFDDTVVVDTASGVPVLRILVGTTIRDAVYTGGSGTDTLHFTYSVVAGDADANGLSVAAGDLVLNAATIKDIAGNDANLTHGALADNAAYGVDAVAPVISTLTAATASTVMGGALNTGDVLTITAAFDSVVTVDTTSGVPRLKLLVGTTETFATYVGGSGTNLLAFRYTVAAGDHDADGISLPANALDTNGSHIRDLAGNAADATSSAVANDPSFKVDGIAPVISGVAVGPVTGGADGYLGVGDTISFDVSFSENVDVTGGVPRLALTIGSATRQALYVSGSGTDTLRFTYTVAAGDQDADGISISTDALSLNGASVRDAAGNDAAIANGALPNVTAYPVDTAAPVIQSVLIDSITGGQNGRANAGDTILVKVRFDEAVLVDTGGGSPRLKLMVGSTERLATYAEGSGSDTLTFSYVVVAGDTDADGVSLAADALALNGGTIRDGAGNNATLSHGAVAANAAITVDTTSPTILGVAIGGANGASAGVLNAGDTLSVDVSFSEAVTLDLAGGTATVEIIVGNQTRLASYASGSGTQKLRFDYVIAAGDTDSDGVAIGANGLSLSAGTITDAAGNPAVLSFSAVGADAGYRVDTTAPTVSAVSVAAATGGTGPNYTVGATVAFDVQFNELVYVETGSGTPKLLVTVGGTQRAATYVSGSGSATLRFSYTIVSGDTDADGISISANALNADGGTIRDGAGNDASLSHAAVADAPAFRVDTTPATIQSVAIASGTGQVNDTLNAGDTIALDVKFSEAVTVSTAGGVPALKLMIGGTQVNAAYLSGSGGDTLRFSYTVKSGDTDANGIAAPADALVLNGGAIRDAAGNDASLVHGALSDDARYMVDTTAPQVLTVALSSATGRQNDTLNVGDVLTVEVAFSEAVSVTTTGGKPRLKILIGATEKDAIYDSGSGTSTLRFTYTVANGDTDTDGISMSSDRLSLNGSKIQDVAGNDAVLTHAPAPANPAFKVDTTSAVLQGVAFAAATGAQNDTLNVGDTLSIDVTYNENVFVNSLVGSPVLKINVGGVEREAVFDSGSGTSKLRFAYTVQAGDMDGNGVSISTGKLVSAAGVITDAAGNSAAIANAAVNDDARYKIDTQAPTVASVGIASATGLQGNLLNAGDVVTFRVSFSEAVTVVTTGGKPKLAVNIGGVSRDAEYASGSGSSTLSFTYTIAAGDTDGDGISIDANKLSAVSGAIRDAAGNDATLTHPAAPANPSYRVDTTPPTVELISLSSTGAENGFLSMDDQISVTLRFDDIVFVTLGSAAPTLKILVGDTLHDATYVSGDGSRELVFTYTVAAGDVDPDGISIPADSVALHGSTIRDSAGNNASTAFTAVDADPAQRVDTSAPTVLSVSLTSADADGAGRLAAGDALTVTVHFSEGVHLDTSQSVMPTISILIGDQRRDAVYESGAGTDTLVFRYVVTSDDGDAAQLSVEGSALSLNGNAIRDSAGNDASLTYNEQPANPPLTLDTTHPTILEAAILPRADGTDQPYHAGDAISFTLRFSEAVEVDQANGTPRLKVQLGSAEVWAIYDSGSGTDTLAFRYDIAAGDTAPSGIAMLESGLDLGGGAIGDLTGNGAALTYDAVDGSSFIIDTTAPALDTVAIQSATNGVNGYYKAGDTITFAASFSEAVTVDTQDGVPQLKLTVGSFVRSANYASGSGSQTLLFTYQIQPGDSDANGISVNANGLELNAGTIRDVAGNDALLTSAALPDNPLYRIDTQTPILTSAAITAATGARNTILNVGDTVTMTVSASEALYVDTSAGQPTLTLNIGGTERQATYVAGSGSPTLTFSYTIAAGDADTNGIAIPRNALALNGATIVDIAGNALNANLSPASDNSAYKVDTTAPTLSNLNIVSATGLQNQRLNAGDVVVFDATFSELVFVDTAIGAPALKIRIGSTIKDAAYVSGSGTSKLRFSYTVVAGDYDADGLSIQANGLAAAPGSVTDLAGTDASPVHAEVADNAGYLVDAVAPTVSSIRVASVTGIQNQAANAGDVVTLGVTFAEQVQVTTAGGKPQLAVQIGGNERIATYVSGSGSDKLLFAYTIVAGDTDVDGIAVQANKLSVNGGRIRDLAGNDATLTHAAMADDPAVKVDTTNASISSIAIGSATGAQNGRLNAGDTVSIVVTFSEAITVDTASGAPKLQVNVGGVLRDAVYSGGSGTASLSFTYVIAAGETDSDGIAIPANGFQLNGAALHDLAGNAVSVTSSAVADNGSYLVDTTAPTVSSVQFVHPAAPLGRPLTIGDTVSLDVTFGEVVSVLTAGGTPSLAIQLGSTTRQAVYVSGSGTSTLTFTYTVAAGDNDLDGISVGSSGLVLNGGAVNDLAGNPATLTHAAVNADPALIVDTTPPSIASVRVTGATGAEAGILNTGDVVSFEVTFAEPVLVDMTGGTPVMKVQLGSALVDATYVGGSGTANLIFAYTIHSGDVAPLGIGVPADSLRLSGSSIHDLAGNAAVITSNELAADAAYPLDAVSPVVETVAIASATDALGTWLNVGDVLSVTVGFNKTVAVDTSSGTPHMKILVGGVERVAAYSSGSGSGTLVFTYTIQAGDADTDGVSLPANGLTLDNGRIHDVAGNDAALVHGAVADNGSFRVDTTAPNLLSVALEEAVGRANDRLNAGDDIVVTARFDEIVLVDTASGVPTLKIRVGNIEREAIYQGGSGTDELRFVYRIAAGDNDTDGVSIDANALTVPAGTVTDRAGNAPVVTHAAVTDDPTYLVDTVAPSIDAIAILSATGAENGRLSVGDTVRLSVTFTEVVNVDTAGGAPVLSIRIGGTIRQATYLSGSGSSELVFTYSVVAGDTDADGISIDAGALGLNGATIRDRAGNDAVTTNTAVADDADYRVDTTAPTILEATITGSTGAVDGYHRTGATIALAVRFSEAVVIDTSNGQPQLKIVVGGVERLATYSGGGGTDLITFDYTVVDGDTDADGIAIPADALVPNGATFHDLAGNAAVTTSVAAADDPAYRVDTRAPQILSVAAAHANGAQNGYLNAGDIVTLAVTFDEVVSVNTDNGSPVLKIRVGSTLRDATYSNGAGTATLLFAYTIQAGETDADGISINANSLSLSGGAIHDAVGNAAILTHAAVDPNPAFMVDAVRPVLSSVALSATSGASNGILNPGDSATFDVGFDEAITVDTTGGSPTLSITIGGVTRAATYVGGSGSQTLQFRYVIAADDTDAAGIAIPANAVTLNGSTLRDLAGNDATLTHDSVAADTSHPIDTTAPIIDQVLILSGTGQNGVLNAGDSVDIEVRFSEAIVLDTTAGTPVLKVQVGSAVVDAQLVAGASPSDHLLFRYIVQAGQTDADGLSIAANAFTLGGATVRDLAGNDASIGHAAVADDAGYKVDTTAPSVSSIAIAGSAGGEGGLHNLGDTITFEVRFSEPVSVDTSNGQPVLKIMVGGVERSATYQAGSGGAVLSFTYTVQAGDDDANGISIPADALGLGGSVIADPAGNNADLASAAVADDAAYRVDTTPPSVSNVSVLSATGAQNERLNSGDVVTLAVEFSEQVTVDTVNGTPTLSINIGGITRTATYGGGSGTATLLFTYTIQAGETDADGISVDADALALAGSTIVDTAGNAAVIASPAMAADANYRVDTTAPAIQTVAIADSVGKVGDFLNAGDTVSIDVTFAETVVVDTQGGVPTISIDVGGTSRTATYVMGSGGSTLRFAYTVVAGDHDADGIAIASDTLVMNGGTIRDLAGNDAVPTHAAVPANTAYRVDTVAPAVATVAISGATGGQGDWLNAGDTVTFDVIFDEPVTVDTSGGAPVLSILVGGVQRLATYEATTGSKLVFTYTIAAGDNDASGLSVPADGLQIGGAHIRDAAGNDALTSSPAVPAQSAYKVDTDAPMASSVRILGATAGQGNYLNAGDIVSIEVTFAEDVFVTGGAAPTIEIDVGGTLRTATYDSGTGSNKLVFVYQIAAGDTDVDGISVPAGSLTGVAAITDAAGNVAAAAIPAMAADPDYLVDTAAPTVVSLAVAGATGSQAGVLNAGDTLRFTVTFSEVVTVETTGGVPLLKVNVGGVLRDAVYANGSGNSELEFIYTVAAGDTDLDGVVVDAGAIDLAGGLIRDAAANDAVLTHDGLTPAQSYPVDTTQPAVASLTASGSGVQANALNEGDVVTVTVAFTEIVAVDTTAGVPILKIMVGGVERSAVYTAGSGSDQLTFAYTVQAGDTDLDGISIDANALLANGAIIADPAGNLANLGSAAVAADAGLTVDTTAPTVVSIVSDMATLRADAPARLTITFSEAVNGLTLSALDAAHGTLSNLVQDAQDPAIWTVDYVADANAGLTSTVLTVAAGGYTDLAGNAGTAGASAALPVDTRLVELTVTSNVSAMSGNQLAVLTLTFSQEPVGLTLSDIVATRGTVSNLVQSSTDPKVYTVEFRPSSTTQSETGSIVVARNGYTSSSGNIGASDASVEIVIDNDAPVIATTSLTANENGTAVGQISAADPHNVTFAIAGTGADDALFTITADGTLAFRAEKDFEHPDGAAANGTYVVKVTATDDLGNVAVQDVTVQLVDANDAPRAEGSVPALTAVTGRAGWSFALSSYFVDEDAVDTRSYSVLSGELPDGLTLDAATGLISGTPVADAASRTVVVRMEDKGGLFAEQTITIRSVSMPRITGFDVVDATGMPSAGVQGEALTFTVRLSEAVSVTSSPTITFLIGGETVTATYLSGSGSDTLTFEALAPSGNGDGFTIGGVSGSIEGVGSNQQVDPISAATAAYILDNTAPVIVTTQLDAAENGTAIGTVIGTDATALQWSLDGTADDNAQFAISADGVLTFIGGKNFEAPDDVGGTAGDGIYIAHIRATDAVGHETVSTVSVHLTNVNEAPVVAAPVADQMAVVGETFSFVIPDGAFSDPDAGTALTYTATLADGSALPSWLTFDAATRRFEATSTPGATSPVTVQVTASDGSLSVSDAFVVSPTERPRLSTTLGGVTSFDVRSAIVITVGEDVLAASGGKITLTDLGGPGFYENVWRDAMGGVTPTAADMVHTQVIDVTDTSQVQIVGSGASTRIIIHPTYQLDLSSNYSLSISTGAFTSTATGLASHSFDTIDFSTVNPSHVDNGLANGTMSKIMNLGTGLMEDGTKWVDITAPAEQAFMPDETLAVIDLAADDYVLAIKNIYTIHEDIATIDTLAKLVNFGAGDLLYIDNQRQAAKNWRTLEGWRTPDGLTEDEKLLDDGYYLYKDRAFELGLGSEAQPFQLNAAGSDLSSTIQLVIDPAVQLPAPYASVEAYNQAWYSSQIFNIVSNGWSHTGVVITA